jgi:AcrR family transcriptional regulator
MANESTLTGDMILDKAEQVFRRFGPAKTSVLDVARALEVSHGNLYRFYPSKAALRQAVTGRWLQRIIVPLNAIAEQSCGHAIESLRLWMDTLIKFKRTSAIEDSELFKLHAAVTEEAGAVIEHHFDELVRQVAEIVRSGMASKEFVEGDSEMVAKGIILATARFHHPAHVQDWTSDSIDDNFNAVWNIIIHGIAQPK